MPQVAPDADGFIRLAEFVALNATVDGDDAAVVEDLRLAFGSLDVDGSGAMSSTELAHVLHCLG
jgi:calcium-binding protein CML